MPDNDRLNKLWDFMHRHSAESGAWWKEQRNINISTETKLADHETRIRANEHIAAKAAFGAVMGGMVLVAILAAIAAAVSRF